MLRFIPSLFRFLKTVVAFHDSGGGDRTFGVGSNASASR